ncbi:MAG: hypothetical protein PVI33_05495 [Candidatus Omnitrophota bacterium]|jgi:hypothetical protein
MKQRDKKYILANINQKSIRELSSELHLKEKVIKKFLRKHELLNKQSDIKKPQGIAKAKSRKLLQTILFIILLLLALWIGIALRLSNLDNVIARSPDEGVYAAQASVIAQNGTGAIRELTREYNADKRWWLYPHPLRVGYLLPLAAVMRITHNTDIKLGAYISTFFSIMTLLLIIVVGRRFFNQWITLYALLFISVSPMSLAIARRNWQDAMLGFIGFFLIYLCCQITLNSRKIIWYILFVISGSYCLLIKLIGAPVYLLSIAWILWLLFVNQKAYLKGVVFMASVAIGAGISIAYLSYLAGSPSAVIQSVRHMLQTGLASQYRLEFCTGKWYEFFELLWVVNAVNTILCLIGIAGMFLSWKTKQKIFGLSIQENRRVIFGIIFFMLIFMSILAFTFNLRHISVLHAPFYLLGGLGLWYIISLANAKLQKRHFSFVITGMLVAIIFVAVKDYQNFQKIIVDSGIKDLSIGLIRWSLAGGVVQ